MKKEITFGAITGLLIGSTLLTPMAVYRTEASVTAKSRTAPPLMLPKLPAEAPLADYSFIDERNLFQPAVSPELPRPKPVVKVQDFNIAPPWVPPTNGWVYAGYFTVDGITQAILQQPEGEASFVKSGDSFLGGRVEEITPERVRLSFGEGHESVLAKSDVYNAVPTEPNSRTPNRSPSNANRRPSAFNPGAPARLQPINRNPSGPSGNPPATGNPNIQERAAQLRALWEARRQAREQNPQQPAAPPPPAAGAVQ
jgi:hypothetical protein